MKNKNNNRETLMKLIIGLYVLKLLQQEPAHGNKLAMEIKQRTCNAYTPNTNALYPLLRKMEEKGYVLGKWDNPDTRGKRVYYLTEAGAARIPALESILEEQLQQIERNIELLRTDLLGK